MNYAPIKTEFRRKNFHHLQLQRTGDVAIYSRQLIKSGTTAVENGPIHFEVIIISRHDGYKIADQYLPPAETYPSGTQWGTLGWTYTELKAAQEKFAALLARNPVPEAPADSPAPETPKEVENPKEVTPEKPEKLIQSPLL